MSLRKQLLLAFGVQGAGAASVLLATVWLGAVQGPEQQGVFNRTKAEIEFVAALALLGLPQALFFYVQTGGISLQRALRWAAGSVALALLAGAAYAMWQQAGAVAAAGMGLAVAACVCHGQLRALLLVGKRSVWFNAVTALPQVLLLLAVAWVISGPVDGQAPWPLAFFCAFGAAAVLAAWRLHATRQPPRPSTVAWHQLAHYGLAAWLLAVLSTGAMLLVQRWVELHAGAAALGQFTLAMTLVLVPLVPIAYAAPLLFRRWMSHPDATGLWRWSAGLCGALLICAGAVWLGAAAWPDLGLGPAYDGTTRVLAVLLAGAAAEAALRLMTVQAGAQGRPWLPVRAEALRGAVLLLGWMLPLPAGLLPLCAVWSLACWAAAAALVWPARAQRPVQGATP